MKSDPSELFDLELAMRDSICKTLAVEEDKLDRLTSLPINVIHQIQEYMSIEDAARMSVLSSSWRYVWSSNPKLIFNKAFCRKRTVAETIDIITTVLLQHHGPIKRFNVAISLVHSSQHSVVDKWMLFLSRNGLLNLSLAVYPPYKLPSYMYGLGLECLVLSNCIFRPPCSFKGFDKLKHLELYQVAFELDVATSSVWMPNLQKLTAINCSGLHFLNIYAPELIFLIFYGCGATGILKLSPFKVCKKLEVCSMSTSLKEVSLNRQDKAMKLTNLLNSWPSLSILILDTHFLKCFASGTSAERLPMCLTSLRLLRFLYYSFDNEDQISHLLYILRRSPNLMKLEFFLDQRKKDNIKMDVKYFEGTNCTTEGLNNLQTLEIRNFYGSRTEMHFVRFVLASTPLLRKAILLVDTSVSETQSLKITKALMRFPRASPISEVIYEPMSSTIEDSATTWYIPLPWCRREVVSDIPST